MLWLTTRDLVHGSYYWLDDHGTIARVTSRPDEGDDVYTIYEPNT